MKKVLASLTLLICSFSYAEPPKVPAPMQTLVGEDYQITINFEKDKKAGYALGFDSTDCLFFRGFSEDPTQMSFLVRPKKAGKFYVNFWTVGEGTSNSLIITAAPPAPVPPPTPPVPPTPPDPPVDQEMQTIYDSEVFANKKTEWANIQLFLIELNTTINTVNNVGSLYTGVHNLAQKYLTGASTDPNRPFVKIRTIIENQISSNIVMDVNAVLTDAQKKTLTELNTNLLARMKKVKI